MNDETRRLQELLKSARAGLKNVNTDDEVSDIKSRLSEVERVLYRSDIEAIQDHHIRKYWPVIRRYGALNNVRRRGEANPVLGKGSPSPTPNRIEVELEITILCHEDEFNQLVDDVKR